MVDQNDGPMARIMLVLEGGDPSVLKGKNDLVLLIDLAREHAEATGFPSTTMLASIQKMGIDVRGENVDSSKSLENPWKAPARKAISLLAKHCSERAVHCWILWEVCGMKQRQIAAKMGDSVGQVNKLVKSTASKISEVFRGPQRY